MLRRRLLPSREQHGPEISIALGAGSWPITTTATSC
jgi:hypothetical protein